MTTCSKYRQYIGQDSLVNVYNIERGGDSMSLMDVKCEESIYITESGYYNDKDKKILLLGKDCYDEYLVYLFFSLPSYAYIKNLKEARLILFKLPNKEDNDFKLNQKYGSYSVAPLLNFFSTYACMYSPTFIDCDKKTTFRNDCRCSYTEIDITHIVKAWTKEEIENKGLLLYGNKEAPLVMYASNQYKIEGMRPRLRLVYEDACIIPCLASAACTVTVR